MEVVLSDKARSDLLRIHRYLEGRSPNAADAFIRRIDKSFENLVRFPFIGRERPRFAPGIRCLVAGLHLIFYIVGPDQITIVRVIDARMNVDEEFFR
jgi:toxin ParE1/3/4